MHLLSTVASFLRSYCPSNRPLLIGLSGGGDSLCLFYCLLHYRDKSGIPFRIAHVDHRWRNESKEEAALLEEIAIREKVPFHLHTLDPRSLVGNLESASRKERYSFFARLIAQYGCEGVLTAHHRDDQVETVLKRILEGAHWSRWKGLREENWVEGARVLRPFLGISKGEIKQWLRERRLFPFEDPTNRDLRFLRPRLRHVVLPHLTEQFGKRVEGSLIELGEEGAELARYFESRLSTLVDRIEWNENEAHLDWTQSLPETELEVKYALRLLSSRLGFFLSRTIIKQMASALLYGKGCRRFLIGGRELEVRNRHLFIRK